MLEKYSGTDDFKEKNGYTIDDVWYPRITRIVSIKAKPALDIFYAQVGGVEKGKKIAQKSADEGTLVHETVEGLLLGRSIDIDPSIAASAQAFLDFQESAAIRTSEDHVEKRVLNSEYRYAGTVDALAWIGGKFGVLDIKTSQAIYRDYNLQTSAYMGALIDQFPDLETRWILRIDQIQKCVLCQATRRLKGGREKIRGEWSPWGRCDQHQWSEMQGVVELKEFPSWRHDFDAFLGAKKLWEWENHDWLSKIGYL